MRIPSLFKYELYNVVRGKWLAAYAFLFAGLSEAFFQLGSEPAKVTASLMNVVLIVIPMVSLLYSSIYWYNADGFTALLLTQPVRRRSIYLARWSAISLALCGGFLAGTVPSLALHQSLDGSSLLLLSVGVFLTLAFVSLGLLISVSIPDRMLGIGASFLVWFYLGVVHDGLVFLFMASFREYPLEVPSMVLTAISPVDLGRLSLLLSLDQAALMGYTGSILQRSLNPATAGALLTGAFLAWIGAPLSLGVVKFQARDL